MAKMEPSEDAQESATTRVAVYNTIRDMVEAKKATGVPEEFHIAGRGALESNFSEEGQRDMATFLPLVLIVIVGTLYCTFRSLRGVLLPLAVVVVLSDLDPGADGRPWYSDVLHLVHDAGRPHGHRRGGWHSYSESVLRRTVGASRHFLVLTPCWVTMGEMWQPVILTSLTTAAGFLSFLNGRLTLSPPFWGV